MNSDEDYVKCFSFVAHFINIVPKPKNILVWGKKFHHAKSSEITKLFLSDFQSGSNTIAVFNDIGRWADEHIIAIINLMAKAAFHCKSRHTNESVERATFELDGRLLHVEFLNIMTKFNNTYLIDTNGDHCNIRSIRKAKLFIYNISRTKKIIPQKKQIQNVKLFFNEILPQIQNKRFKLKLS